MSMTTLLDKYDLSYDDISRIEFQQEWCGKSNDYIITKCEWASIGLEYALVSSPMLDSKAYYMAEELFGLRVIGFDNDTYLVERTNQ